MQNQITHTQIRNGSRRVFIALVVILRVVGLVLWRLLVLVLLAVGSIFKTFEALAKLALVCTVVAAVMGRR